MRYFSTLRYLIVLLALLCSACGTALPSIKPYKLDVQQGNVVTSKMLLQLRPGMTKSQVRFIMGTPLIQDSFHGNRWDYVYQMREAGKVTEQRRVILDFENDLLKTVRGDVIPKESVAPEDGRANTGTRLVEPYKKPEEKSLINKLKFWESNDASPANSELKKAPEPAVEAVVNSIEQSVAASDADASKSMLAVPLVVPVAPAGEVAVAVEAPVAQVVKEAELVAPSAVALPAEAEVAKASVAEVVAPAVTSLVVDQPVNTTFYESPSGMVFDRQLRSLPEEVEPEMVTEIPSTRVGNKVMPTPKDLPAENEPSFFDRMLEKIGF